MTEAELILKKALVGSNLDSSQWNQIQAAFRNRAFFSSRIAEVNILEAIRNRVAEYSKGETDISKIRMLIRQDLETLKYSPEPGEKGTIHDLFSQARLDTIIKTNVAQARGYIQYLEGSTPGAYAAFPAQEFTRVAHRQRPRADWPQRWAKAGGKLYKGRMVALKDDPVWAKLSVFGNPFPPFDWGSGMGVLDVDRKTAIDLGLITDSDLRQKVNDLRQNGSAPGASAPAFNSNLQATVPVSDVKRIRDLFDEDFGDLVKVENGVVKWRGEVLRETVLEGKNFSIKMGRPQKGLLDLLRSDSKLEPFADAIDGKQLTVTQDWRDTKRRDGGTHLDHFYPLPDHPEDIPLKPEDMEMLPSMWRKSDRAFKLRHDLFMTELDAFDGSTYVMQIAFNKSGGPKLWAFFKTTNPTSKKLARRLAARLPTLG